MAVKTETQKHMQFMTCRCYWIVVN